MPSLGPCKDEMVAKPKFVCSKIYKMAARD